MTSQTSWRMLAISAAVAVMLTACGSGGDGDNNGALTKPAADVRLSVDSASNTVTVRLVDADGNVVPVSRDVTVEVPAGSGNTTTVSLTDGVGTFSIPPSANGTDFVVTDPSTGNTFSGTAPNVRFRQDANGNVVVELTGADGNPFAASSQTGVNSAITNANTVDLGSGSASVAIDTQNLGAVPFTLTDPDTGNTFTGIVDTGSYTDANGYYVLGCNDKSPADPSADWATVWDGSTQVTGDLTSGGAYTFKFQMNYLDSAGNQLAGVSRNVQFRIQAGKAEINGVVEEADPATKNTPLRDIPMKDGIMEVELKQIANGPNAEPTFNPGKKEFRLGVRDGTCADAGKTWGPLRQKYENAYTVTP